MTVRRVAASTAAALCIVGGLAGSSTARAYTVKETENGSVVRWHRPSVVLRIDASMERYFTDVPVKATIHDAARAWHDIEGVPELLINDGEPGPSGFDSKDPASNGVYLIENWELAQSSLAVTVATYESRSGKMVDTDILVNANHPFGEMPDGPDSKGKIYDLRGVLTHEMGHVLGLGESYDERMATMWPNISRGETHQRDIDVDDESGVEEAYAGAALSETEAPGGCSGSSVVVQRGAGRIGWPVFVTSLVVLALLWHLLRERRPRGAQGAVACAFALLFASPYQASTGSSEENERVEVVRTLALRRLDPLQRQAGLAQAAGSTSVQVRMAAAAVLERAGTREDRAIAAKLAQDSHPEVRRIGRESLARLHSAPPLARIERTHPEAQDRLARLFERATTTITGEAVGTGVSVRNGLIWSHYAVQGTGQGVTPVQIAGGTLGEHTQVVSEQEPPSDGDTLVVAMQENGVAGWAHYREGVVYGGWLGEGPGIEWTP
ncbi:MAG: matrixin family metalloprotease [Myxococcales bacterium]